MIDKLQECIGFSMTAFLEQAPFNNWKYEVEVFEEMTPPSRYYTFVNNGLSLSLESSGKIRTIFLCSKEDGGFSLPLGDISFSSGRNEVLKVYGEPRYSGEETVDEILGSTGAWDKFSFENADVHFEYEFGSNSNMIKQVTIMKRDLV